MRQRVAVGALFLGVQYAVVQAQTAIWKSPVHNDLEANAKDSLRLDWEFSTPVLEPWLTMWCANDTYRDAFNYVSGFKVDTNGPFEYILDSYYLPFPLKGYLDFPLICKAQLTSDNIVNKERGGYMPHQLTFTSDASQAKKTVSETQSVPPATTTTDSPSQSTSNPTSSTEQSSTPTGGLKSDSSATTVPVAPTSSSHNNIGAIVGGVVGGVAIIAFIIFAIIFMRNVQRKREASPATTESKRRSLNPFDAYKLWPKAHTTGIFEKDANGIIFEKDGDGMIIEKDGDGMIRELEANTVGGRVKYTMPRQSLVELPGDSSYYR
ncbi:hypothetical protein V490_06215 [Pseudogymnoascus sp. VKM F-3557]|nr:hypothetical protein V490_06215 [Pseudogymnoascus sp. VKM F-3557]